MADQWEIDTLAAMPHKKWCDHCYQIAIQVEENRMVADMQQPFIYLGDISRRNPKVNIGYITCPHWTPPHDIAGMLLNMMNANFRRGAISLKNNENCTIAVLVCH